MDALNTLLNIATTRFLPASSLAAIEEPAGTANLSTLCHKHLLRGCWIRMSHIVQQMVEEHALANCKHGMLHRHSKKAETLQCLIRKGFAEDAANCRRCRLSGSGTHCQILSPEKVGRSSSKKFDRLGLMYGEGSPLKFYTSGISCAFCVC